MLRVKIDLKQTDKDEKLESNGLDSQFANIQTQNNQEPTRSMCGR